MTHTIDVVDEHNTVVGQTTPEDAYAKRLNHRIVHVLIFNDKGELYLTQQSANQTFCPGHWNSSASGDVHSKEKTEKAALRELDRWLAATLKLTKIHDMHYDHYKMRKFITVFRGNSHGPFSPNPQLCASGKWFSIPDVHELVKKNQLVHPELAHVIEELYPSTAS